MRLSFYPIVQYFDGKGELLPAGDLPPLDDEVDPPPSGLGTGGETQAILILLLLVLLPLLLHHKT